MDIQLTYEQKHNFLNSDLFIGIPASRDMGDRIALIGLIAYVTNQLKQKKPEINVYKVVRSITKDDPVPDTLVDTISLLVEYFMKDCTKFPDFGIPVKEMPKKIIELIHSLMPF